MIVKKTINTILQFHFEFKIEDFDRFLYLNQMQ